MLEHFTGSNVVKQAKILWNSEDTKRHFISDEDVRKLWRAARDDEDRVILGLGTMLGLRRVEMARLRVEDIVGTTLTIRGKGHGAGKTDQASIPSSLCILLSSYIRGQRAQQASHGLDDGYLLLTRGNRGGRPITADAITTAMEEMSEIAGISVSPHCLRRYYCMTLADKCGLRGDLDTLRRMMRHENVHTTLQCYLEADRTAVKAATDALDEAMLKYI